MADNTLQTGSANIAADDVASLNGGASSGVLVQRMKVMYGDDGTARDVSDTFRLPTAGATLSNTATITTVGQTASVTLNGLYAQTSFQVGGVWSGTLTFEASNDGGTSWSTIVAHRAGDNTTAQTIIGSANNDIYRCVTSALGIIRLNANATITGTATISIFATENTSGVFLNLPIPPGANTIGAVVINDATASGTLTGASQNVPLALNGDSGAAVQITGTWAGTITFEGTVNGTDWSPINGTASTTSSPTSTTTVNGLFRLTPSGLASIRANMTAFTSGSAAIAMRASDGAGGTFANQILPTKNTDGTSTQAIKPASTAATLADAAGVVQDANIGNQADASATTDAGTFSLIALTKRLLSKLPAALGGTSTALSLPVALASDTAAGSITTQNLVPAGAATAGSAVEIVLNGAASLAVQTTGTFTGALSLQATTDGAVWVTVGGTPFLNVNTGGYLAAITSALQSVFQADVGGFTKARITALAAVTGSAAVTLRSAANPSMIALDASLPAGTNAIGSVTVASGTVTTVSTVTSVAASTPAVTTTTAATLSSAATTNATSVKASAGNLYSVTASNVGAAAAFLKVFNLATAPTVGTSVPFLTIPIAPSGVANITFGTQGIRMSAGIAFAITNLVADADTTAIAAAQVKIAIAYI